MKGKFKSKENIFWIIFIILVLVTLEAAIYFSTGNFELCGRYTGCAEVSSEIMSQVFSFLSAILLSYVTIEGLARGQVLIRGSGIVTRKKQPLSFWVSIGAGTAASLLAWCVFIFRLIF